jgi:hypothetical protein
MMVKSQIKIHSAMGTREVPVTWMKDEAILTTLPCPEPGHQGPSTVDVTVPKVQAAALNQGAYVQRALTSIDADTRERFISGVCPRCWNRLFA